MTSLRVSILCTAAVGSVFHSKPFAGSSRLRIPGVLVIFFSRSFGAGIRTFFKPHCPRLDSQEEMGGSLGVRTQAQIQGRNEMRLRLAQINS